MTLSEHLREARSHLAEARKLARSGSAVAVRIDLSALWAGWAQDEEAAFRNRLRRKLGQDHAGRGCPAG
ncbi:MAG: hypothetical protein KKC99_01830 [Proteobacteria bacterium]|nr:hypothetical protein [Pseudomonadota bacterium]